MHALLAVLIGLSSGAVGSLITAFFTSSFQHKFWIRQQKFDLCVANLRQLHRLVAELNQRNVLLGKIIIDVRTGNPQGEIPIPDEDVKFLQKFLIDWTATTTETKCLFPESIQQSLNNMTDSVLDFFRDPLPVAAEAEKELFKRIGEFISKGNIAFDALYSDLGFPEHKRTGSHGS